VPKTFNDRGELFTRGRKFIRDGAAVTAPTGCNFLALNNRSQLLCSLPANVTPDHRATVSSYAIWDGQALRPLTVLDTFPSTFFTAWTLNDAGEVVGTFTAPAFTNPACQVACGVIWRDGQPTFLPVTAYQTIQMNNRRDLLIQRSELYTASASLYEAGTGRTRKVAGDHAWAYDVNEQGWVVGTLVGDRWTARSIAFLSQPDRLMELGTGEANGINNAGDVVGVLDGQAVVWKGGAPSPLTFAASDTNWTVTRPMKINNLGQIVAQADDSAHAKFNRWVVLTPIAP
jgi:hypothetical protein